MAGCMHHAFDVYAENLYPSRVCIAARVVHRGLMKLRHFFPVTKCQVVMLVYAPISRPPMNLKHVFVFEDSESIRYITHRQKLLPFNP